VIRGGMTALYSTNDRASFSGVAGIRHGLREGAGYAVR
jgi:hypothetical protein